MSYPRQSSRLNRPKSLESINQVTRQHSAPDDADICDSTGKVSLHLAIMKLKNKKTITRLLDEGANIHARNDDHHTPFDVAIQNGYSDAALLLIKRGALVQENLHSLLSLAISVNSHTIVKIIIDHAMYDNPSVNLINSLQVVISQGNPIMIGVIMPHCGFSKPSDLYIPKKLVVDTVPLYKNCVRLLLKWNFTIHPDHHRDEDFIYRAVEDGHLPIVVDLLEREIDVNIVNPKTRLNLLTIACLNKHHEIMEKLLEHNADATVEVSSKNLKLNDQSCLRNMSKFKKLLTSTDSKQNSINVSCLHIAVFNSDPIATGILLRCSTKTTNDAELFNLTCLAASNNCEKIVDKLLDHGVRVTDVNTQGKTLLHFCILEEPRKWDYTYSIVKQLLEKGVTIHLQTPNNPLVFEAVKNRHHKVAQLFLDHDADVQYVSPNGETSLHAAVKYNFGVKFIKHLLKLKSPVNTVNSNGFTPLFDACIIKSEDQIEIIKTLIDYNADVDYTDGRLVTPLFTVCYGNNLQIVNILLNSGANPNAVDCKGQTPLHVASKFGGDKTASIIQLLLKNNANSGSVDKSGWTPLLIACKNKFKLAVECLLKHHADVNVTDAAGRTALYFAVKHACVSYFDAADNILQLLIKHGATGTTFDKSNQTPLHYVVRKMMFARDDDSLRSLTLRNNCERIIKILVTQGIKLKTAGFEVYNFIANEIFNHDNYIVIDNIRYPANDLLQLNLTDDSDSGVRGNQNSTGDLRQLRDKCEQEIEMMKEEHLGIGDLTYYDLLKRDVRYLSRFMDIEKIQQFLEEEAYDKKFPLYKDIVRNRLRDAEIQYIRNKLIYQAREYFKRNINQVLPYECIDLVLSYLNIGEMKTFIETMKILKG